MSFAMKLEQYNVDGEGPASAPVDLEQFKKTPVIVCSANDCTKATNLKKCNGCGLIQYCGKECQRADWPSHKASCQAIKRLKIPGPAGETAFTRQVRLFTARFELSLISATISALELRTKPGNIDDYALWVTVSPRTHREAGARFVLEKVEVIPMADFTLRFLIYNPIAMNTLEEHKRQRAMKKRQTGGASDFATMAVRALNTGPHRVSDGGDGELRFKPIAIQRAIVRSALFNDPTMDWQMSLRIQIANDLPHRPAS